MSVSFNQNISPNRYLTQNQRQNQNNLSFGSTKIETFKRCANEAIPGENQINIGLTILRQALGLLEKGGRGYRGNCRINEIKSPDGKLVGYRYSREHKGNTIRDITIRQTNIGKFLVNIGLFEGKLDKKGSKRADLAAVLENYHIAPSQKELTELERINEPGNEGVLFPVMMRPDSDDENLAVKAWRGLSGFFEKEAPAHMKLESEILQPSNQKVSFYDADELLDAIDIWRRERGS